VDQAIAYLKKLPFTEVKPGLSRIRSLIAAVGHPEMSLRAVHVGGTNGKGSVVAMLASVLQAAGQRVGVYTSPHLVSYRERIRINGDWISEREFSELADELMPIAEALSDRPSQFEFLTAMAFLYFARRRVDWAVIEVGLGGRFDATNVISPALAILTNVELDHTDLLGETLEQIAWEKAGIAKPGVPLVTGEAKPGPASVIERECQLSGARWVSARLRVRQRDFDWDSQELEIESLGAVRIKLLGRYQMQNVSVAMAALRELQREFPFSDRAILEGLARARWPGRFEIIQREPYVILDGAHNLHGARALREEIERYARKFLAGGRAFLLFGMMRDKDFARAAEALFPVFDEIYLAPPNSPRAADPVLLSPIAVRLGKPASVSSSAAEALHSAGPRLQRRDLLCVAGSLYIVGQAEQFFGRRR
jgi:dihydrofolate synthase/folylpolyglutamate synthase